MSFEDNGEEISVPFACCLMNALANVSFLENTSHLYTTTVTCKNHTTSVHYDAFIENVIRALLKNVAEICTPTTGMMQNNYCHEKTQGFYNAYVLFLIVIFIIGLVGNSLVCFAFLMCKKLRMNVGNYFITSLAVADLFVIFFQVTVRIMTALHNGNFCASLDVCRLYAVSDRMFFVASITNIFVLTIDRYITITRPYDFWQTVSPLRSKIVITCVWLYAVFWGIFTNYNSQTKRLDNVRTEHAKCVLVNSNYLHTWFELGIVFFLPCVAMLGIYVHIYLISLGHAKNIDQDTRRVAVTQHRRSSSGGGRNSISKLGIKIQQSSFFANRKLELRATKIVVLVYGTFVVCWLPAVFSRFVESVSHAANMPVTGIKGVPYIILCEILPILNSILNPFIYGVVHRDFRSCLKKVLGISHLQHERRESGNYKTNGRLSISLTTARSYVDHNVDHSSAQDTTLDSAERQAEISSDRDNCNNLKLENLYPVYNIPEDFYPDSEIPEHDISNPETPEPCKEKRFFAFTEKKLPEILEALQECNLEDLLAGANANPEKKELLGEQNNEVNIDEKPST